MPSVKNLKILIVDDQDSMRSLMRHALQRIGINQVEAARNGEDALARLEREKFDLIISDWNMEGISGLDLLNSVRQHPVTKKLPFIMATAERSKSQVMAAIDAGVNSYVAKPFSVKDLKTKLEAVLGPLT